MGVIGIILGATNPAGNPSTSLPASGGVAVAFFYIVSNIPPHQWTSLGIYANTALTSPVDCLLQHGMERNSLGRQFRILPRQHSSSLLHLRSRLQLALELCYLPSYSLYVPRHGSLWIRSRE